MEFVDHSKWDSMNLKDDLLRGIYAYGFENPSNIQKQAIPILIDNRDLIAQAQSGCGKTGAFSIATLQQIDLSLNQTQALILVPTHELAKQIAGVIQQIGSFMQGLRVKTLIGGTNIRDDVRDMDKHTPHIIVGCVGRVYDMFQKRYVMTTEIQLLILDEADEMLSRGFNAQIKDMFQYYFSETIQVGLFSATVPNEMLRLSGNFMRSPERISVKREELSLKCIEQYFVASVNDDTKYDTLKDLFGSISASKCIVYCNSVNRVVTLYESMMRDGFSVCHIHSNMEKTQRYETLSHFRTGDSRVLISSDITARGIDIQQVSVVVNFDIPRSVYTYLHRIGRGGRWGRKGTAINFVTKYDIQDMRRIESYYQIDIKELTCGHSNIVSS
jgi:translation initiation factor 4A